MDGNASIPRRPPAPLELGLEHVKITLTRQNDHVYRAGRLFNDQGALAVELKGPLAGGEIFDELFAFPEMAAVIRGFSGF